jgi:hypothetical protein
MKRRVRKIANFFAFNLLFFALYLNFIHKDPNPAFAGNTADKNPAAAFSADIPSTKQIAEKKIETAAKDNSSDEKLAIN